MYWGGMILILIVPAVWVRAAVLRVVKGSALVLDLIAAVAIAVVIAPPIWAFNAFVMGFDVHKPGALAEHLASGLLICLVPAGLRHYVRQMRDEVGAEAAPGTRPAPEDAPDRSVEAAEEPVFLRRLDPDRRGAVWRVSADDHQLAVSTSMGESRIRLRFSDAVRELEAFDGTLVHRSHWVAHAAIRAVVPDGRRHRVVLHDGTEVPVSQNRLPLLRAAGITVGARQAEAQEPAQVLG